MRRMSTDQPMAGSKQAFQIQTRSRRALSSAFIRLESLQTEFGLLHLEPLETGLAAVCLEKRMSMLCRAPLHRGVLTTGTGLAHGDWQQHREAVVCAAPRTVGGRWSPPLRAVCQRHGADGGAHDATQEGIPCKGGSVQGGVQFGAGLMVG